jgi:hypothetical protein
MVSYPVSQAVEALHPTDRMFHTDARSRMLSIIFDLRVREFWFWIVF